MIELAEGEAKPEIVATVATKDEGTDELWDAIARHRRAQEEGGLLRARRRRRIEREIRDIVAERQQLLLSAKAAPLLAQLCEEVEGRRLDPYAAADRLLAAL